MAVIFREAKMPFNHFDEQGRAVMVDISAKSATMRTAVAMAKVYLRKETLADIMDGRVKKGDVLGVARLAGIAAAKKTPDLIPLSHPLALHAVSIDFRTDAETGTIEVESTVRAFERTGVEMGKLWLRLRLAPLPSMTCARASTRGSASVKLFFSTRRGAKAVFTGERKSHEGRNSDPE
jgi:cyclic pyranopterin phosphate synthase